MKSQTRSGYILLFTLMTISLIVLLVSRVFNQGTVHAPYMRAMIDRQKAEFLALSGVSIAMSQLLILENEQEKEQPKPTAANEPVKNVSQEELLLKRLLPILNRWQQFTLDEKHEGINGQIKLCIGCESGKIDLNSIYDFKQKKFVGEGLAQGDYKKLMKELFELIEKINGGKNMMQALEKFLKDRSSALNDATELLTLDEFSPFKRSVFYEPTESQKEDKPRLYLTDLFTVFSGSSVVEPWLFSDSLITLFQLKRATADKEKAAQIKEWLKNFKQTANWSQDWNTALKPVYGRDFAALPKNVGFLLNPKFEPKIFSVLSYGKIGQVTQKLLVIVERSGASAQASSPTITIKKIYWL